ncbi:hypothetical protein AQUCO_03500187v1 [Aquilegia coerulea]|uniref:C2H2-type domain-containing protein n=1 Tax=Aquilegia coerulea TaxID=218851 RepID=A0A2G5CWM1_AQUCA|nr:hypothetical protein AQUCO_03500187v1 [Aquilegia coerulea]
MAMVVDQSQPTFKHFCRICNKGFMCGRALGGHMRAHGIIGDDQNADDHQHSSDDWEDHKLNGNNAPSKRMYALRTNPNRLKSCKICANCGKEFTSWKLFLEHGKCKASDDVESSFVSSPRSRDDQDEAQRRECGWFKGKRTRRANVGNLNLNCPSTEEEDLANCLVMLSSARVDPVVEEVVEESSCASASREEDRRYTIFPITTNYGDKAKGMAAKGMFECKACKKSFNSHQALGGHRASHKKVKGCFAAKLDDFDETTLIDEDVITNDEFSMRSRSNATVPSFEHSVDLQLATSTPFKRKSKVHECSICHRIFSSGQALGGHKRCHWITSNSSDMSTIAKFQHFKDQNQFHQTPIFSKSSDALDLNLPASTNDKNQDPQKDPLSLEISTAICLQSWGGVYMNDEKKNTNNDQNNNTTTTTTTTHHFNPSVPNNVDEEVESKVKLAKLNDLKDLHMMSTGESSPWLQVGIGSTSNNMASDP